MEKKRKYLAEEATMEDVERLQRIVNRMRNRVGLMDLKMKVIQQREKAGEFGKK